ncbi:MAG: DUF3090 domain-containing protein [Acidimicrobiia bacterium]|nr:DUF3090 domain-containing protein [Acidimicrobiia bacterium]
MADSLEFRNTTRFIPGTVGEPGQRIFFLQIGDEVDTVTVKLEKQQVRALAQFLRTVLEDLPSPTRQPGSNEFNPPTEADWVVGQIAVGVDEAESKVVLVIDELIPDPDGDDEFEIELQEHFGFEETAGSQVRAHVSVDLAATFIVSSEELMAAGRPPCSLCGQPLDPEGHACPRLN